MFKNLFASKNKNAVYAPVTGKCIELAEVNDPVFAEKMMGDGLAFQFDGEFVSSPVYGEVVMVANSRHAVGVRLNNGAEILIHVGLETVGLNGKGLRAFVKVGESIRPGDQLIMVDRKFMEEKSIDLTTMVIVTNGDEYEFTPKGYGKVKTKDELFNITKKG